MLGFLTRYAKVIVAVFAVAVFAVTQSDWFKNNRSLAEFEGILLDRRCRLRGARPADPNIQIVGIGSSSLDLSTLSPEEIQASEALRLMNNPFPWDRKVYAILLEKLIAAGAKVVVFDFVFKGPTSGDSEFAQALHKYKDRVVIGSMFADTSEAQPGGDFASGKQYFEPEHLMLNRGDRMVGYVNCNQDVDGVYRREQADTSLEREKGILGFPDDVISLSALAAEKSAGNLQLPPYDSSNFIDYLGPSGTFQVFPIENIFSEALWKAPPCNAGAIFRNKIVIVGPIAEIFHDTVRTPFGVMPGPEVQAMRISNLLRGATIQEASARSNFFVTLSLIVLALGICLGVRNVFLKGVLLLLVGTGFFFTCQFTFSKGNMVLAMISPMVGFTSTGVFGMFFLYILEWVERRRTRTFLEKYVSRNVAKTILKDEESFLHAMKGRKQNVAILFCDIRGFTSMTESSDATELVNQLNEYFATMVHIIEDEKSGTLQKFIGDAIMAAWGDTYTQGAATDCRLAIESALGMRRALKKLNEDWKGKEHRTQLAIGIGINHGEVVVGNIGYVDRIEFTVLGDGVNLAARLESATKQFHTDVLIGGTAAELTREFFVFRSVGRIAFKGKSEPVEVYFLLGDKSMAVPSWLAIYEEGVQLYREAKFCEAVECFKKTLQEIGTEDYLCDMYLKRCALELERPAGKPFNDSFTLTEK